MRYVFLSWRFVYMKSGTDHSQEFDKDLEVEKTEMVVSPSSSSPAYLHLSLSKPHTDQIPQLTPFPGPRSSRNHTIHHRHLHPLRHPSRPNRLPRLPRNPGLQRLSLRRNLVPLQRSRQRPNRHFHPHISRWKQK